MDTVEGIVKGIRFATEVAGTDSQTSTAHVAVFELDGKAVELKLSESIILAEGDKVLVAGEWKRGLFRGLAYFNKTRGVKGKQSTLVYWVVGIAFCISVVLSPFGIWAVMQGLRYQQAFRAVDL